MGMTGFGAFAAGFRTAFAVVVFMLAAFCRAMAAGCFAHSKQLMGKLAVSDQQPCGKAAKVCAIAVDFDTVRHCGNIAFFQTGSCTSFTGLRTLQEQIDQSLVLMTAVVMIWILWFVLHSLFYSSAH